MGRWLSRSDLALLVLSILMGCAYTSWSTTPCISGRTIELKLTTRNGAPAPSGRETTQLTDISPAHGTRGNLIDPESETPRHVVLERSR